MINKILVKDVVPKNLLGKTLVGLGYGVNDASRKRLILNLPITEFRWSMDTTKQHHGARIVIQRNDYVLDFFVFENEEIYFTE